MFTLNDLKKTRVYQDAVADGVEKAKFEAIPRMVDFGLKLEEIAHFLDLPLNTVTKFVEKKRQEEMEKKEFYLQAVSNMIRLGLSLETIAEYLNLSLYMVQRLAKKNDKGD